MNPVDIRDAKHDFIVGHQMILTANCKIYSILKLWSVEYEI